MFRALLASMALCWSAASASGLDVDEIVSRGLEALGGVEQLRKIETRKISGQIIASGGAASGTFVLTQKKPNQIRFEADILSNTFLQVYDGREAWQVQPPIAGGSGQPEVVEGLAARSLIAQGVFESPLIEYKKKGHKLDLLGREQLEGRDVYHLRLTLDSGSSIRYYMDCETYLVHRTIVMGYNPATNAEGEIELLSGDYRVVDGIQVAHALENRAGGQILTQLITEKVEFNPPVDEKIFRRPSE